MFRIIIFIKLFLFSIIFSIAHSQEITVYSQEELIENIDNGQKKILISSKIIIDKEIIIPNNVSLKFSDDGYFFFKNIFEMNINGEILGAKKKIFFFEDDKEGYKNLKIKKKLFDVRWFGEPEEIISQKYSSFHNKTMYLATQCHSTI